MQRDTYTVACNGAYCSRTPWRRDVCLRSMANRGRRGNWCHRNRWRWNGRSKRTVIRLNVRTNWNSRTKWNSDGYAGSDHAGLDTNSGHNRAGNRSPATRDSRSTTGNGSSGGEFRNWNAGNCA